MVSPCPQLQGNTKKKANVEKAELRAGSRARFDHTHFTRTHAQRRVAVCLYILFPPAEYNSWVLRRLMMESKKSVGSWRSCERELVGGSCMCSFYATANMDWV